MKATAMDDGSQSNNQSQESTASTASGFVKIQKSAFEKIVSRLENLEQRYKERETFEKPESQEEDYQQYHPHSNFKNKNFKINNNGQNNFSGKNSYRNYKNRSKYNPNALPYPQNLPNRMRNSNRLNSDGSTSTSVSQENNAQQGNNSWIPANQRFDYGIGLNRRQPTGFYRKIRATVDKMLNNKEAREKKPPIIYHNYYN